MLGPDDIDVGFVPCFRAQVTAVSVAEEAVLHDDVTGELYALNHVAKDVRDPLDGRHGLLVGVAPQNSVNTDEEGDFDA